MSFLSVENQYRSKVVTAQTTTEKAAENTSTPKDPAVENGAANAAAQTKAPRQDTFVRSARTEDTESAKTTAKGLSADQLKEIQDQQLASFQNMLKSMFTTQADKAHSASKGFKLSQDLFSKLTVSPEEQARAAQAISEDGQWGVNAVATRIMDMAVALSGGDTSKIDMLQQAVEKGFKAAGVEWGTSMPSITGRTHDEIGKRFDYWKKNGSLDGYEYKPGSGE